MFSAEMILDSVSPDGIRLTTMRLTYPRMIHAEFMTHRVFSRNASSSRAIPVAKMIDAIEEKPASPVFWGKNQPGMQAAEELTGGDLYMAQEYWRRAARDAIGWARAMNEIGVHKQIVNRLLEPFGHITVLVTSTDYANFFALRRDKAAQPEIQALADEMFEEMRASTPTLLTYDQWHLPFVSQLDVAMAKKWMSEHTPKHQSPGHTISLLTKISAARCARVSYLKHDQTRAEIDEDLALYEKLVGAQPMHASPAEHQATPDRLKGPDVWTRPELHGNFLGWCQHRKMLKDEHVVVYHDDDVVIPAQRSNQKDQIDRWLASS